MLNVSECVQRIMKGEEMRNKQIISRIIQFLLVAISVFIILEFHQHNAIPYMVKWVTTIVLIVTNCVYNHWRGLRDGIEINERHENRMRELRKQNYDKIADIVIDEKINAR